MSWCQIPKNTLPDAPFSDIALCSRDIWRLRACCNHPIMAENHDALLRFGLARHLTDGQTPGGMPIRSDRIEATDRGRACLDYHRRDRRRFVMPQALSLLAVVVSFLALALNVIQFIVSQ